MDLVLAKTRSTESPLSRVVDRKPKSRVARDGLASEEGAGYRHS